MIILLRPREWRDQHVWDPRPHET